MMNDRENLADVVNNAVRTAVAQADNGALVTKSVTIYEFISPDGRRKLAVWPSEDARWWDVLGMTQYAQSVAQAVIGQEATA